MKESFLQINFSELNKTRHFSIIPFQHDKNATGLKTSNKTVLNVCMNAVTHHCKYCIRLVGDDLFCAVKAEPAVMHKYGNSYPIPFFSQK